MGVWTSVLDDASAVTVLELLAASARTWIVASGQLVLDDWRAVHLRCLSTGVSVGGASLIGIHQRLSVGIEFLLRLVVAL